ncbi:MAG: 4-hydroxy-tetrahydrodipicolinate synthase [Holosporales bacterium]|jgi:4-hydroxy-tetrahydrodipicolinate synthase|nr:4-hydroxy-tetrahydrodipicolinate synthase [Holosporales bacterium]
MFDGSIVALVTPFKNGEIDFMALEVLIEMHIDAGTNAILVCGSTGEGLLLTEKERRDIISHTIKLSASRIPVLVGCSTCSTAEAIGCVRTAQDLGANGSLVCAPFYIKPSQMGILEHFKSIHDSTDLPIIVYNNPGRCAVNISVDTILELSQFERIVALKESDTNLARVTILKSKIHGDFKLLSGDDLSLAGFLAHGGDGAISVTANVEPTLVKTLIESWKVGDIKKMQECDRILSPLSEALFLEPNPVPVKYALSLKKLTQNELRLPLLPATPATEEILTRIMD